MEPNQQQQQQQGVPAPQPSSGGQPAQNQAPGSGLPQQLPLIYRYLDTLTLQIHRLLVQGRGQGAPQSLLLNLEPPPVVGISVLEALANLQAGGMLALQFAGQNGSGLIPQPPVPVPVPQAAGAPAAAPLGGAPPPAAAPAPQSNPFGQGTSNYEAGFHQMVSQIIYHFAMAHTQAVSSGGDETVRIAELLLRMEPERSRALAFQLVEEEHRRALNPTATEAGTSSSAARRMLETRMTNTRLRIADAEQQFEAEQREWQRERDTLTSRIDAHRGELHTTTGQIDETRDTLRKWSACATCPAVFSSVNDARTPEMLPCGHTFCRACVTAQKRGRRVIKVQCPTCDRDFFVNGRDRILTNFHITSNLSIKK